MELLFLLLSSIHLPNDYMFWQWFVGLSLLYIPICIWAKRKTSGLFACLFLYHCIWSMACIFLRYGFVPELKTEIIIFSAIEHLGVLVVIISLLSFSGSGLSKIKDLLPVYGTINSVYVIGNYVFENRLTNSMGYQGFLDYSGMNAALIAICFIATMFKE